MSEHKFEFKPKDFDYEIDVNIYPDGSPDWDVLSQSIVKIANAKIAPLLARLNELEKMIEDAPTVYRYHDNPFWQTTPMIEFTTKGTRDISTHKAKLVMIEEIK